MGSSSRGERIATPDVYEYAANGRGHVMALYRIVQSQGELHSMHVMNHVRANV